MKSASIQSKGSGERTWAMVAHLSALSLYLGLVFTNLLFPYLIWRWQKNRSDFVAEHALAVFNYQFTFTAAVLVSLMITLLFPWAWLLVIATGTVSIVLIGKAADRAKSGQPYRYPGSHHWIRG